MSYASNTQDNMHKGTSASFSLLWHISAAGTWEDGVALQSSSTRLVDLIHPSGVRVDLESKRDAKKTLSEQIKAAAWTLGAEYKVSSK